jgi:pimeloyl-ACP methyl ester carboxylesterase
MSHPRHIVFLHGFLEDPSMWDPLLGYLSKKDLTLHFPVLPGHRDRVLPDAWTIDAWADDVRSQLSIDPQENAFFIGHSMGGYVLSHLAVKQPELCRGLCLFHSKVGADAPEKKENRLRAIEAAKQNQSTYVSGMISALYNPDTRVRHRDAIERQIERAKKIPVATIEASHTVMRNRPDHIAHMRNRHFPLFYFLGEQDAALPVESMRSEVHALPGAAAHIAPTTGHMGHIESAAEAGGFIQRVLMTDRGSAHVRQTDVEHS